MGKIVKILKDLEYYKKVNLIVIDEKGKWINALKNYSYKTRDALGIIKPYAIFDFNNSPFLLFFDHPTEEQELILHKQVWCFNQAPIVIIIKDTDVEIYNAFKYEKSNHKLEKLDIDDIKKFSYWEVLSGNAFKYLQENFYKSGKKYDNYKNSRVDQTLINNIKSASTKLMEGGLDETLSNLLLLRLIFTRYLIDREVKIIKFFDGESAEENKKILSSIIKDIDKLYELFNYLHEHFNGNLFQFNNKEIDKIIESENILEILSELFEENTDLETGQTLLFNDYDFKIIPVELISSIYECIIRKDGIDENASIYTPTFLVDYILSKTLAPHLNKINTSECKILDPACGSGIFLVECFRKIVEKEAELQNIKPNQLDKNELVDLLINNIYGIDKNIDALNITCFSLYVALLDYKEPKEIDNFNLPELIGKTLFESDFFDQGHDFNEILKAKNICFVLGNPPWQKLQGSHIYYCRDREKKENKLLNKKNRVTIKSGNNEIAEAFLIRLSDIAPNATYSLIITSKFLYNRHSLSMRKYFLSNYHLDEVFDLSPVRFYVFEDADNPAVILIYRYGKNKKDVAKNIVKHISIKPNLYLMYFNNLVIEKNDYKKITQEHFLQFDWLWKVALYGNVADVLLMKKLMDYRFNIDLLIYGKIIVNRGETSGKGKKYSKLRGLDIKQYYTYNENSSQSVKKLKFVLCPRRTKNENELVVSFSEQKFTFDDTTIVFKSTNVDLLYFLYGLMISDLYSYYQFMYSANWGVYRPEININEHKSFPVPVKFDTKLKELVKRFITYYRNFYCAPLFADETPSVPKDLLKQINDRVRVIYNITIIEQELIDYFKDISRNIFRNNISVQRKLAEKVSFKQLHQYAEIFYDHFGEIYNRKSEYFQIEIYQLPYYVAMNFKIVKKKPKNGKQILLAQDSSQEEILKKICQRTSIQKITRKIYQQRDVHGFEGDSFYIIKPNENRCWHKTIARADLNIFIEKIMYESKFNHTLKTA